MSGDIELDGTKLAPDEADERWLRAGRVVRERNPDTYRRTFALAEGQAAVTEHSTDPDGAARAALLGGGVAQPASAERDRIRAVVSQVLAEVEREPIDALRFSSIDMMLRSIDWSRVPVDLVATMFRLVTTAAPLEALQLAHPAAGNPVPVAGIGLEAMATDLMRIAAAEAGARLDLEAKGDN